MTAFRTCAIGLYQVKRLNLDIRCGSVIIVFSVAKVVLKFVFFQLLSIMIGNL